MRGAFFPALSPSLAIVCPSLMWVCARRIVLNTLKGLEDDRRCYRLIGGVLVERTVAETRPEVQTNHEGVRSPLFLLFHRWPAWPACPTAPSCPSHANPGPALLPLWQVGKVIKQLAEQFAAKEKELLAFQAKHNIQVRGGDGPAEAPAQQAKSQGVLV